MLSLKRGTSGQRDGASRRRVLSPSLTVSLAVNAVVLALFFQAAARGLTWADLLTPRRSQAVTAERIGFVRLPPPVTPSAPPTPGRSGGDGRPVRPRTARPAPTIAAPTEVPTEIPPPAAAAPVDAGGTGPVVGAGGATEGIRPNYTDGRLWGRPGTVIATAPRTAKERIDSVILDRFAPVRDSIARAQALAAGQRGPGDWTVNGPGGKWGMDQGSIHLGKVKIPNAVLALLGEQFQRNLRGNPVEAQREARLALIRQDIMDHAQREMSEDEFRTAVRRIRERKDKERADKTSEAERQRTIAGKGSGAGDSRDP